MVMAGFPPPHEQRWTLEGWQQHPQNRWTFLHLREVLPTARVARGAGPPLPLPSGVPLDLDIEVCSDQRRTVRSVLDATYTDGFLVLHDGKVVIEEYPSGMDPLGNYLLMSVSKSLIGCVTGILVDRGTIDVDAAATDYIPELSSSGYAGATVRHLLDIRSGVRFSETYLDPDAEVRQLEQVIGCAPRRNDELPHSMYEFLASLQQEGPHGEAFSYDPAKQTFSAGCASVPRTSACPSCCGRGCVPSRTWTRPSIRPARSCTTVGSVRRCAISDACRLPVADRSVASHVRRP